MTELANDLTPAEKAAIPAIVTWSRFDDARWRARGEWVLHWRTRRLQRPKRSQHHTIDQVLGAARKLSRWHVRGEGRWDVKITFRDRDPAAGVSAFADDARERLATIEREEREVLERDKRLGPKALRAARKEAGDVSRTETIVGAVSLLGWLLGRGGDERPQREKVA